MYFFHESFVFLDFSFFLKFSNFPWTFQNGRCRLCFLFFCGFLCFSLFFFGLLCFFLFLLVSGPPRGAPKSKKSQETQRNPCIFTVWDYIPIWLTPYKVNWRVRSHWRRAESLWFFNFLFYLILLGWAMDFLGIYVVYGDGQFPYKPSINPV